MLAPHEKGIHELSSSTGIPASTTQRLVNTLQTEGYLIQNPITLKYHLGFTLYRLYKSFSQTFNWIEEAGYHIEKLVSKHNETTNLACLEGRNVVYLNKVDSTHIIRPNFNIGTNYPAYCTALGKCLLAYLSPDHIERIISTVKFVKYTENTITDSSALQLELKKIRKQGFAVDNEEFQDDLLCVAAPIINEKLDTIVAAVSVAAPKSRISMEKIYIIKDDLIDTATKISGVVN